MASGALCSDHVNYLILRYLQEAGHENAAIAFWRDWHRLPEFKDPENYPFAPVVRRGELVNVIQDGLQHDELIARVKKNERKFHFTSVTTREALERRGDGGAAVENGVVGSRPGSSGKRKGARPLGMPPPDEFPTPAPKRQRRSEGSEGVQLNGDAMDVDPASGSPDGDADEDGTATSPGEGEEVEIVEVPERYDSMDAAVQTTVKAGPATKTMYWKVDKPGAVIHHSAFSPAVKAEGDETTTLLTVGESLCRFYQVPNDVDDSKRILSIDDPTLPPNAWVTAATWSPDGSIAACAIDSYRDLPDGKQESQQTLLTHSHNTGTSSHYIFPPLLEPGAIVLALRYQAKLLVVRTNGKRGLVLVYETNSEASDPVAWKIFEHPVLDAIWTEDEIFVVCGEDGILEGHRVHGGGSLPDSTFTPDTIPNHGLKRIHWVPSLPGKWDKVRFDKAAQILAVASTEGGKLAVCAYETSHDDDRWTSTDLPGQLTALAFQVKISPRSIGERQLPLLAAAFEDGACALYTCRWPLETNAKPSIESLVTVHVSSGPALALAWTPDGAHLAVGGTELVQIWETGSLVHFDTDANRLEKKADAQLRPLVTWRPDATATGPRNGEHEPARPLTEPSLSWSSDGESLAFAVDKQIAVIKFQTPLSEGKRKEGEEVNGVAS